MNSRIHVGVALLALASVTVPLAWKRSTRDRASAPATSRSIGGSEVPIDALVSCVQAKFHNLDGIGISRLGIVPGHVASFDPETPEEKRAVSTLREEGWDVAFYLGGRGLLAPQPSAAEWDGGSKYDRRRAISAPIFMTDPNGLADVPHPRDLWVAARRALDGTAADQPAPRFGRWSVVTSPILADRQACLGCHRRGAAWDGFEREPALLKVGDPLGVAVFVYSRTPR